MNTYLVKFADGTSITETGDNEGEVREFVSVTYPDRRIAEVTSVPTKD